MDSTIEILPSLLAADCAYLAQELARLEAAGACGWHVDVMDGHFVPNITMGPAWVKAVRCHSRGFIDVHLMTYSPSQFVQAFVDAGADRISFHLEATEDIDDTIALIHSCGKKAGLAVSPQTPVEMLEAYLAKVDLLLVMTVQPGFGGQSFLQECLQKVDYLHQMRAKYHLRQVMEPARALAIQVDGGIDATTGPASVRAGADSLVSGTYLFRSEDPTSAMARLKR